MAEAPKLNTSRYTGEAPAVQEQTPEEKPVLVNRYAKPTPPAKKAEGKGTAPYTTAAIRGIAGAPGMPVELLNFVGNIPKYTVDIGGGIVEKAYNMFADEPADLPLASQSLGLPELKIPGGTADMKQWLGAPDLVPADSAVGRVTQAGIEGGLESVGPAFIASMAKKALPKLMKKPGALSEFFLPTKGGLKAQATMGGAAGAGALAGMQIGEENDSPTLGLLGGVLGAATPIGLVGARRQASSFLGARDPAKLSESPVRWAMDKLIAPPGGEEAAKANMMNTFDKLHPDYRYELADKIDLANSRAKQRVPEVNLTTGMLTDDPALGYLLGGANQRSGSLVQQAANDAREQLRGVVAKQSPGGNSRAAGDSVMGRVEATIANIVNKRKAAEQKAGAAEVAAQDPAITLRAAQAEGEKSALADDLYSGITSELDTARANSGAALEAIKQSGAKISGNELENWRTNLIKAADKQGQKGLVPDFLNPKIGGLNEELYPTAYDGVTPPSTIKAPSDKDIQQVIGWDQVLREQETAARLAGDGTKAHWAGEARRQLNSLLETQLGGTGYTDAKKAYLDNVVKRFYTPTVDPLLGAKHLSGTTGQKVVPSGPKGAQAAKDVLAAVGDDPAAGKAFVDYTLADFAGYAYNVKTGKIDVAKANSWLKNKAPLIAELRTQAANGSPTSSTLANLVVDKLDDVMKNQATLDEALSGALAQAKTAGQRETKWTASLQNKSAARFLLGKDPEAAAKQILASPNLTEDSKAITRLLSKDPAAQVGLQQAIFDNLSNEMSSLTAKVDPKNIKGVSQQIQKALAPYQKLEDAGTLPKGFTKRARTAMATEYSIRRVDKSTPGGSTLIEGSKMAQNDVSQFGRGIFGSRSGNLIAGTARDMFGQPGTDLLHRILRDAALDPKKMTELLRAEDKGTVGLRVLLAREAAVHGYEKEEENGR